MTAPAILYLAAMLVTFIAATAWFLREGEHAALAGCAGLGAAAIWPGVAIFLLTFALAAVIEACMDQLGWLQ